MYMLRFFQIKLQFNSNALLYQWPPTNEVGLLWQRSATDYITRALHLLSTVLLSGLQSSQVAVNQYLVYLTGLVGIVNAIVFKSEPIYKLVSALGHLGHGQLSQF